MNSSTSRSQRLGKAGTRHSTRRHGDSRAVAAAKPTPSGICAIGNPLGGFPICAKQTETPGRLELPSPRFAGACLAPRPRCRGVGATARPPRPVVHPGDPLPSTRPARAHAGRTARTPGSSRVRGDRLKSDTCPGTPLGGVLLGRSAPSIPLLVRASGGRTGRSAGVSPCRSPRRPAGPGRPGRRSRTRSRPCRPRPGGRRCPTMPGTPAGPVLGGPRPTRSRVGVDHERVDLQLPRPCVQHRQGAVGRTEREARDRTHGVGQPLARADRQRCQAVLAAVRTGVESLPSSRRDPRGSRRSATRARLRPSRAPAPPKRRAG